MADVEMTGEVKFDAAKMKRDIKKAAESADPLVRIKLKAEEQFEKFTLGIKQGIFGNPDSKGGPGGIAGVLGKSLGQLALITATLGLVLDAIGQVVDILAKASPAFKGTLMIFEKAMLLFFKPFGDFLGQLLRPLAFALLKMAVEFNKLWKQIFTPDANKLTPEDIEKSLQKINDPNTSPEEKSEERKKLIDQGYGGAGTEISDWINQNIFGENFKSGLQKLKDFSDTFVMPLLDGLGSTVSGIVTTFGNWFNDSLTDPLGTLAREFQAISEFWTENVSPAIENFKSSIGSFWSGITQWWTESVDPHIENFKTWWKEFWQSITTWLDTNTLWQDMKNLFTSFVNKLIDAINGVIGWINDKAKKFGVNVAPLEKKQVGSEYIPEEGMYYLHRGEKVVGATQQGGTGNMNFTMNLSINNPQINNGMDINKIAELVAEQAQTALRRKVGYGRGFI